MSTLHPCPTSYVHPTPALAALPVVVIYALKDLERMNVVRHRRSAMKFADCLCKSATNPLLKDRGLCKLSWDMANPVCSTHITLSVRVS